MKDKIKVRWWLHLLFITLFIATCGYLYYRTFFSGLPANQNDLLTHQFTTFLISTLVFHFIWLLYLLIKLLSRQQFIPATFIFLLGLVDIALINVVGFIWAATLIG